MSRDYIGFPPLFGRVPGIESRDAERLFDDARRAEHATLLERPPDYLDSHGQSSRRPPGGDADHGQVEDVERLRVAEGVEESEFFIADRKTSSFIMPERRERAHGSDD